MWRHAVCPHSPRTHPQTSSCTVQASGQYPITMLTPRNTHILCSGGIPFHHVWFVCLPLLCIQVGLHSYTIKLIDWTRSLCEWPSTDGAKVTGPIGANYVTDNCSIERWESDVCARKLLALGLLSLHGHCGIVSGE